MYASNNIFILSIPLGDPSDKPKPTSSLELGTVYANHKRVVDEFVALANRVKVISSSDC